MQGETGVLETSNNMIQPWNSIAMDSLTIQGTVTLISFYCVENCS